MLFTNLSIKRLSLVRNLQLLAVFCVINMCVFGENIANFGITSPQDPSMLPKSKVPVVMPTQNVKKIAKTVLQQVGNDDYLLTNGWELAEASKVIAAKRSLFNVKLDTDNWYNATVPGTVLTTLVDQGVYPDPYFGVNNLVIPDTLCRTDWWYRIKFTLPKGSGDKNVWLLFEGINYKADIWLNGAELGPIHGAFCRGQFNATRFVKRRGENVLAVRIHPPHNPGIPHEESPRAGSGMNGGQLCLDGPTFISSEGWDWMPGIRDRNIGIWQNVHLKFTGAARLIDPQVITDLPLPDITRADVTIRTGVKNISGKAQKMTISGTIEDVTVKKTIHLEPGETSKVEFSPEEFPSLTLKSPRLWWPNNYGKQELYDLDLKVTDAANAVSDVKRVRFGVRELSYEMMVGMPNKDKCRVEYNPTAALKDGKPLFDNVNRVYVEGGMSMPQLREGVDPDVLPRIPDPAMRHYLVLKVNGHRIFCKGGNWGMDDGMKNTTRQHLEPYFRLHRDANLNMVRNWTGESTEEVFYALCDEYGMLVWNDFWMTTQGYNLGINDDELFLANARDTVLRFRNHPSIVIWNPRNEGVAPKNLEERLNALIAKEDGTRHYQPNSTHINLRASGPWQYMKNPADYFRDNAHGFNTEQGTPSVPTAESMLAMMAEEDTWPISDVWYYHDFHNGQNDYMQAIKTKYGDPQSLEDFCKKAQLINYDSHRAMFESWNSRLWNDTSGLLLWMTHPAWPSTVWQIYSWDYETFGSYFGSLKACEPIHAQLNLHDHKVVVINTSLKGLAGSTMHYQVYDLSGKVLAERKESVDVAANRLTDCFTPDLPEQLPDVFLERVTLTDHAGNRVSINDYWKTSSDGGSFKAFNELSNVTLKGKLVGSRNQAGVIEIELVNGSDSPAISIKLNARDAKTGKRILPAYFSDGYFTLLPGEQRHVTLDCKWSEKAIITAEGYNVNSQTLIPIQLRKQGQ